MCGKIRVAIIVSMTHNAIEMLRKIALHKFIIYTDMFNGRTIPHSTWLGAVVVRVSDS